MHSPAVHTVALFPHGATVHCVSRARACVCMRACVSVCVCCRYDTWASLKGRQGGYNYASTFNLVFYLLATIPMLLYFTTIYGKFSDPSIAQLKAARESKTGMV